MKKIISGILFPILLFVSINAKAQSSSAQKLDALLQMISYAYVDTVNQDQLTEEAIKAMLKKLDTPTLPRSRNP